MGSTLSILILGLFAALDEGDDWSEFLGPHRNGTTVLPGVSFDWSEGGPEIVWRLELGGGFGGPAVRDGEVYLLDREIGDADIMRALDLKTGEEKWSSVYESPGRLSYPGSRTVPTVMDKLVYTSSGFGKVFCFAREDGEEQWGVDMEEVYGGEQPAFGWANSPLVIGDLVIVAALGPDVGLVAFDRFTGDEIWVTEPVGHSHSSPRLVELHGEPQIVFLSTTGRASGTDEAAPMHVWSFDPEDGATIWSHEILLSRLPIPGPVQIDDERLFITGGYRGGSTMLKVTKKGGKYGFEELFHIDRGAQIHLPIFHKEHLFLLVNENWNDARPRRKEGGLLCLDLDGEEVWRTGDKPFFGRGNAVLVGDHLLIQDGHNGILRAVIATPAGYEQVAEVNLFEIDIDSRRDHQMWAPMAVAEGHLLMRSQEELLCVRM